MNQQYKIGITVIFWLVACAGCNPNPVGIHGAVTLDGKPLDEAVISFVPTAAGRKKTGGEVVNGVYQVAVENGLLPGKYRVDFADSPSLNSPGAHSRGAKSNRRPFPAQYSNNSPLTIDLVEGGPTEFNFELKNK